MSSATGPRGRKALPVLDDELSARMSCGGPLREPSSAAALNSCARLSALPLWTTSATRIPINDAIILSRSDDPDFRRAWRKRVVDHDGDSAQEDGIERWIRLAEATSLDRKRVMCCHEVLPAVRYAVDAYLDLVKSRTFLEAVASSLTELFSRDLIALRMDCLRLHYPWLSSGLDYFTARLHQAPEDARFALQWVTEHAHTRAEQELAIAALRAKCDILWAQLDAIHFAYVQPGWPPPGAFRMES
jgi:pyrroloquinoline-quinone synthase